MKTMEGAFRRPEAADEKISKRADEIEANVPEDKLREVIAELKGYLTLRLLADTPYQDLPDDIHREIGTRNPMDEFNERVGEFDAWDQMNETYGRDEGGNSKWSAEELEELIDELKQRAG